MTRWLLLLWVGMMAISGGCQSREEIAAASPTPLTLTPTPAPMTATSVVAPVVVATFTPAPTATTAPSPPPSPTPTATPLPVVRVALPATWAALEPFILADNPGNSQWQWGVTITNDPEEVNPHLSLVPGEYDIPIGAIPLAVAVPFTHRWETVDGVTAQTIQLNGHELAQIIPWREMNPRLKPLRVDGLRPSDAGYPLQQTWSVLAVDRYEVAAERLAELLRPHFPADPIIHLAAVGDIMLSRTLGNYIAAGVLDFPFRYLTDHLLQADYTVGNLETALGDIGEPVAKAYPFRSPPASAEALALAGFDLVSLANNHGMDYGPEALLQGISLLNQAGVASVGAGANAAEAQAPHFAEVNGLTLAFLGYVHVPREASTGFDVETWDATANSPGLAWAYPERIRAGVAAALPLADHVIVILHSGFEYIEEPSEPQVAAAHAAIEAGATLVIGHHAHILQGIEFYQQGVILYGLGNFAFNITGPPETAIANIWLDKNGVRQIELIPAIVTETGQPRLALPYEAEAIRQRVYFLTSILNPVRPGD